MGLALSRLIQASERPLHYFLSLLHNECRHFTMVKFSSSRRAIAETSAASRGEASTQTGDRDDGDKSSGDESQGDHHDHPSYDAKSYDPNTITSISCEGARFVFPDVSPTGRARSPKAAGVTMGISVRLQRSNINDTGVLSPLSLESSRSSRRNASSYPEFWDDAEGSAGFCSPSTSEFQDIQIIENPDFTRFGEAYRNLASPRDKWMPGSEPRCRCVSSLSPVKEEAETDVSSDKPVADVSPDSVISDVTYQRLHSTSLNETFPVFDDDDRHNSSASSYAKRLFYYSASSDSGIGDRSRSSSTYSSGCTSASDASDNLSRYSTSDVSTTSHADEADPQDNQNADRSSPVVEEDVFHTDEDSEHDDAFHVDETPRAVPGSAAKTPATAIQVTSEHPLHSASDSLSIRARRKVSFSDDLVLSKNNKSEKTGSKAASSRAAPRASVSSDSDSESARCSKVHAGATTFLAHHLPTLPVSDSACHDDHTPPGPNATFVLGRHRHVFLRQDSCESSNSSSCSSASSSSSDSILAVPLSPLSSEDSPTLASNFVFPETSKGNFAEHQEGSDLVLVTDGERFHVHSSVVAWQCHALLQHLRDTGSNEVMLMDRRSQDLQLFLALLYPFQKSSLNERNVEAMLDLALYLGCERVRRMCVTYLLGLAYFPNLCAHRHLPHSNIRSTSSSHHHHQQHDNRHPDDLSSESSDNAHESASAETGHFLFERMHCTSSPHATSMCACADTVPERVLAILEMSVRYELDEVYNTYLDVAAKMKTDDLNVCSRYSHLSSAVREDILTARLTRLENIISHVGVGRDDLVSCSRSRHASFRVNYNGQLCLKCISRSALHQAKTAV